jgi:hypothetical protein
MKRAILVLLLFCTIIFTIGCSVNTNEELQCVSMCVGTTSSIGNGYNPSAVRIHSIDGIHSITIIWDKTLYEKFPIVAGNTYEMTVKRNISHPNYWDLINFRRQ